MNGFMLAAVLFAQVSVSEHLALGNPSSAKPIEEQAADSNNSNVLLVKPEYAISYNETFSTPNWVSWRCSKEWIGLAERGNNFRADDSLPESWFHVTPKVYAATGFDRGHMCPAGDRGKDADSMSQTFFMTNMIPQAPKVNRGAWKMLESHCRDLVTDGNSVYIVAGPTGVGGFGANGYSERLGKRVMVPAACWKVVVWMKHGKDDAETAAGRVDAQTKTLAVILPNVNTAFDWKDYRTSIRTIEEATGHNFLSEIAQPIQDALETITNDDED